MRKTTAMVRFAEKVLLPDSPTGCWTWTGSQSWQGYGMMWGNGRSMRAHRYSYERFVGPIPEGLHIDHLCRNRGCVNPEHLDAVTNRENILRGVGHTAVNAAKTKCKRGHDFSGTNLLIVRGGRGCRACHTTVDRERDMRQRPHRYKGLRKATP